MFSPLLSIDEPYNKLIVYPKNSEFLPLYHHMGQRIYALKHNIKLLTKLKHVPENQFQPYILIRFLS